MFTGQTFGTLLPSSETEYTQEINLHLISCEVKSWDSPPNMLMPQREITDALYITLRQKSSLQCQQKHQLLRILA